MPSRKRRSAPRHATRRSAYYETDTTPHRRPCRLIDISSTGAAFEPYELAPTETLRGTVKLELVSLPHDTDAIPVVQGTVRHLTRTSTGRVRVGIEFVELTQLEARLIEACFRLEEAG